MLARPATDRDIAAARELVVSNWTNDPIFSHQAPWTIETDQGSIVRIEEYWDLLNSFSTERPDSPMGGALYDVMALQAIGPDVAVCTWQTLLAGTTEAELAASGATALEDGIVAAALECELDPEAIPVCEPTSLVRRSATAGWKETCPGRRTSVRDVRLNAR